MNNTLKIILLVLLVFLLLNYSCGKKENFADDNTEDKCKSCRSGYISGMQCFKNQAPLMKKFGITIKNKKLHFGLLKRLISVKIMMILQD